jgi:hypothetical protein
MRRTQNSTSAPALKEKLKLTRSLLAPLVPSASLQVKQQALTGKILFCFQQNFFCRNQNFDPNVNPALKNLSALFAQDPLSF